MPDDKLDSRTDRDILQDVERALIVDDVVSEDNVRVDVNNGKVVLDGEVGSLEMKQRMGDLAENINGAVLVVNDLRIERI